MMSRRSSIIFGLAVLAIGSAAGGAFAQPLPSSSPSRGYDPSQVQGRSDERGVMIKADLMSLKSGLALKPSQVEAWDAFESAVNQTVAVEKEIIQRAGPVRLPGEQPDLGAKADGMVLFGENLAARGKALKAVDAKWKLLLSGLDEEQKKTADILGDRILKLLSGVSGSGRSPGRWHGHHRPMGDSGPPQR